MKELSSHIKEEIGVHAQKQYEKQKRLVNSLKRQPGQFVYQLNLKTQEISIAEFKDEFLDINGGVVKNVDIKETHWYAVAINEKNAFRKFNNMAKSAYEILNEPT